MQAELWYATDCILGEGPMWHAERHSFFWVDIENHTLYERPWPLGEVRQWRFEQRISLAVPARGAEVIVGLQGGVARFDLETGAFAWINRLGISWDTIRCNDGACDSKGRLWIGTMPLDGHAGSGALYRLSPGVEPQIVQENVDISNGMAWTASGKYFYYTDSATRQIWRYDFDGVNGTISNRKTVIDIPLEYGLPDGFTIDEEGMLWIGLWGGSGVGRWNPVTGEQIGFVQVPVKNVTSCAFAGESLDQLIITTAGGEGAHLFSVKPGVCGLPKPICAL
ncbi:SMP-30/gluconolactonase/LRE family protein [Chitinophaga lutea]